MTPLGGIPFTIYEVIQGKFSRKHMTFDHPFSVNVDEELMEASGSASVTKKLVAR